MKQLRPWQSVVNRLVACLLVGGVIISAGLTVMEWRTAKRSLHLELTDEIVRTTRNLQSILKSVSERTTTDDQTVSGALSLYTTHPSIIAARLQRPGQSPIQLGDWPVHVEAKARIWALAEHGITTGRELDFQKQTLVHAPFAIGEQTAALELLIDGPAARGRIWQQAIQRTTAQWLLLAVMTLFGLLLLRRWFTGPLEQVAELVQLEAGSEPFNRLAGQMHGEFSQLSGAIGDMLWRIEQTSDALEQQKRAYKSLFQLAPTALLSIDNTGLVTQANRRAAQMLGRDHERALNNVAVHMFVVEEDRGRLRQIVERAAVEDTAHGELRLAVGSGTVDVAVQAVGVRDDDDHLRSVRLSLVDVTDERSLQRNLQSQTHLLNLVLDHMSDALLLVGPEQTIAACNHRLAGLIGDPVDDLVGRHFDAHLFWREISPLEPEQLERSLAEHGSNDDTAEFQVATTSGIFNMRVVAVHDEAGSKVGTLWVVQDVTVQQAGQKLASQQKRQVAVLKQISTGIAQARTIDDLINSTLMCIRQCMEVEAVGMAIRHGRDGRRAIHALYRGDGANRIEPHRQLHQAVVENLMPRVLPTRQTMFWPDLMLDEPWAAAFAGASLTCLAASPLSCGATTQGLIWVAQRGGEQLAPHQLHLLETITPLVAARLHAGMVIEQLEYLSLHDPVTDLPTSATFARELDACRDRLGWSLLLIDIDRFRKVNESLDRGAGDAVLREVAGMLISSCRRSCVVARLDGARFGVIAPDLDEQNTRQLAERLVQTIATVQLPDAGPRADGDDWQLSATIGVAMAQDAAGDPFAVRDLAQKRLELAKGPDAGPVGMIDTPTTRQAG